MLKFAMACFAGLAVLGLALVGVQASAILSVGKGFAVNDVGDVWSALVSDPVAMWGLVGLIVGTIGLVALAAVGQVVGRAARRERAAGPEPTGQEPEEPGGE